MDPNTSTNDNKRKIVETPGEPRRSKRARKEKNLDSNYIYSQSLVFLVEGSRNGVFNKIPILLHLEEDPKTYKEALASKDSVFWKDQLMMRWILLCQLVCGCYVNYLLLVNL